MLNSNKAGQLSLQCSSVRPRFRRAKLRARKMCSHSGLAAHLRQSSAGRSRSLVHKEEIVVCNRRGLLPPRQPRNSAGRRPLLPRKSGRRRHHQLRNERTNVRLNSAGAGFAESPRKSRALRKPRTRTIEADVRPFVSELVVAAPSALAREQGAPPGAVPGLARWQKAAPVAHYDFFLVN